MQNIPVKVGENGTIPSKGSEQAAGFDLYASHDFILPVQNSRLIGTEVQMAIPQGYYGQIFGRSGLAAKHGIMTLGGVIDSDYRGEVKVMLYNSSDEDLAFRKGERIAQMVVIPIYQGIMVDAALDSTSRGSDGFGSSGN